ncbi:hypothetical protein ZIOFF_017433 [Zingiber officinale]|uniref:Tify domain-containing protein n=1 Tax=Zingiber officinale TaxID=94328 RepID=A0A8J5H715_ZINOF|nr:hypothetical protein ZIOFF_017433 [Zingiber officinale]
MDSSTEHDFLGAEINGGRPKKPIMERKKSFRDIEDESGNHKKCDGNDLFLLPNNKEARTTFATSHLLIKNDNIWGPVAPFTIFYNGSVLAFNLPHDKAETLLKLVEGEEIAGLVDERNN